MVAVNSCFSCVSPRCGCITVAILTMIEGIVFLGAPTMDNEWYRVAVVWCTFSMLSSAFLLCGIVQNCPAALKAYLCLRGSQLLTVFVTFVVLLTVTWIMFIFSYTVGTYKPNKDIFLLGLILCSTIGLYTGVHMGMYFLVYIYNKSLVTDQPKLISRKKEVDSNV